MRVLLVSDVHFRLSQFDWLCAVSGSYDALVLAGDLLDTSSEIRIEAQIVTVDAYLVRLAQLTDVYVVSGNHDLDGPGSNGEQQASWLRRPLAMNIHTDGETVDVGNVRFTLCPWWDGPRTRSLVDTQLRQAALNRPAWWAWVYHSPPAGTPLCFDGHREYPDQDLATWIAELTPDLVMCGHIHEAPWAPGGSWFARVGPTSVFNAGNLHTAVPPHVIIDTEGSTADWYGPSEGEQAHADLNQPPT